MGASILHQQDVDLDSDYDSDDLEPEPEPEPESTALVVDVEHEVISETDEPNTPPEPDIETQRREEMLRRMLLRLPKTEKPAGQGPLPLVLILVLVHLPRARGPPRRRGGDRWPPPGTAAGNGRPAWRAMG